MKPLFTIYAVIDILVGLALLLVPAALLVAFGITPDPGGTVVARLLGGTSVGIGVVAWFSRDAAPSEALRAFILGLVVISVLGCLVSIYGVLSGITNAFGWMEVLVDGFFAVAFGALAAGKAPITKTPAAAH